MKCEKMLKGEIVDRCQTWDKCGGELDYLMSGQNVSRGFSVQTPKLYKCSSCGDLTVKL